WMLYPSQKVNTLMLAFLAELINGQKYEELKYVGYLQKLSRYKAYDIDNEVIKSEFGRMINTHLIENGDAKLLETFYNEFLQGINNTELESEISYLYNYEQGRALYNQGKFREALEYFEQAYTIKTSNLDINNILVTTLIRTMQNDSNTEALVVLEKYKSKHVLLIENNLFKSALVNTYLIEMGNSYDLSDEKRGLKYKGLYEELYDPQLTIDRNNIGRAYSLAGVYYFRKNNKSKALKVINEGLNMAPHSHELLVRKRMIQ
ncbi:MAG: tetratricopeptide repeat protein, partial [Fulvivirga sp.]